MITLFSCLFGVSCKNIKSFWQKNTEIVLQLCKLNNHLNFYLSVQLECKLHLHSKELKLKYKYFRTKIPSNFLKQKYYIFECCLFCKIRKNNTRTLMRNYKFDYCRHNPIPLLPPIYSTWYSFYRNIVVANQTYPLYPNIRNNLGFLISIALIYLIFFTSYYVIPVLKEFKFVGIHCETVSFIITVLSFFLFSVL